MAMDIVLIWGKREAEYFCRRDWTGQITLIRFDKSGCARTHRGPDKAPRNPDRWPQRTPDLPAGQSAVVQGDRNASRRASQILGERAGITKSVRRDLRSLGSGALHACQRRGRGHPLICPLLPQERTSLIEGDTSERCHFRTHAPQQQLHSITSSAQVR